MNSSALASDGPEEDLSLVDGSNHGSSNSHNFESARIPSYTHSRQSSTTHSTFSPSPSLGSPSTSVLGRRSRELGPDAWSSRDKVRIREFAADKCAEYELSAGDRLVILKDSELSTHELMVVVMCKLAQNKSSVQEDSLAAYIKSSQFKDNVVLKLKTMLLDPNLSSFKTGAMERILRHIRINAISLYRIPAAIRDLLTGSTFAGVISKALTNCRASMKHKLSAHLMSKSDIYAIVKDLSPSTHESSEELWARWAWVHLMYADFTNDIIKAPGSKFAEKDFWPWLDAQLQECRTKYSQISDEHERRAKFNGVFERALTQHKSTFPPKFKPKTGRPPAWQTGVAKAVIEMDGYTPADLADGSDSSEGHEEEISESPENTDDTNEG